MVHLMNLNMETFILKQLHFAKIRKVVIPILILSLAASVIGNTWLVATLKMYRYNLQHQLFIGESDELVSYPVHGAGLDEVKQVIDMINSETSDQHDRKILLMKISDSNNLEVVTGIQDGPISGGGKIFRFKLINGQWILDRTSRWTS